MVTMSEPIEGRWTTEPPTVPRCYWWRFNELSDIEVVRVYRDEAYSDLRIKFIGSKADFRVFGEWWTIPYQEPPK